MLPPEACRNALHQVSQHKLLLPAELTRSTGSSPWTRAAAGDAVRICPVHVKTIGCNLEKIGWAIVTHFHMDHAGLLGELIARGGVGCFVFENQHDVVDAMERTIEKNVKGYRRIDQRQLVLVATADSRKMLGEIGVRGEVVITDYHSPDSVSFVLMRATLLSGIFRPWDRPCRTTIGSLRTGKDSGERGRGTSIRATLVPLSSKGEPWGGEGALPRRTVAGGASALPGWYGPVHRQPGGMLPRVTEGDAVRNPARGPQHADGVPRRGATALPFPPAQRRGSIVLTWLEIIRRRFL